MCPTVAVAAVRFGRVPKKEKARIIEQMQRVNSQSQASALSTILQNEQDVVHAVINAHRMTCDLSLGRVSQMRDHALQLSNYINCPANMVSHGDLMNSHWLCGSVTSYILVNESWTFFVGFSSLCRCHISSLCHSVSSSFVFLYFKAVQIGHKKATKAFCLLSVCVGSGVIFVAIVVTELSVVSGLSSQQSPGAGYQQERSRRVLRKLHTSHKICCWFCQRHSRVHAAQPGWPGYFAQGNLCKQFLCCLFLQQRGVVWIVGLGHLQLLWL